MSSQKSRLHRLLNLPPILQPEHPGFSSVERVHVDGTVEILHAGRSMGAAEYPNQAGAQAVEPSASQTPSTGPISNPASPSREADSLAGAREKPALRLVAPDRLRDLTPDMAHNRCVCGVRVSRHYDGWDGNRLSCEEALRRHGVA